MSSGVISSGVNGLDMCCIDGDDSCVEMIVEISGGWFGCGRWKKGGVEAFAAVGIFLVRWCWFVDRKELLVFGKSWIHI